MVWAFKIGRLSFECPRAGSPVLARSEGPAPFVSAYRDAPPEGGAMTRMRPFPSSEISHEL